MNRPACSVIIPTYNCLGYLPGALASVEAQNVADVEVLVLDDGSSDGTWAWLERKAQTMPGLRIFSGGGLGPARGRNLLINEAKSDLVGFLDADDLWSPGKLAAEIAFHAANPDVALTFTDYIHASEDDRPHGTCFDFWKPEWIDRGNPAFQRLPDPLDALLAKNVVGTSAAVAKRKALQIANGFSEILPSAEDWDLWLRLAQTGAVAASPSVAMTYLMRPGGETSKRRARIKAMETIIMRYRGKAGRAALRAAESRLATAIAEDAMSEGRLMTSTVAGLRAFRLAPSRRAARAAFASLAAALTGAGRT